MFAVKIRLLIVTKSTSSTNVLVFQLQKLEASFMASAERKRASILTIGHVLIAYLNAW